MKAYLDILRLVWPLALGMVNNALLQFTDRAFLAHESMASLEAVLPASMLALIALGFFQAVVAYSGTFVAQYYGAGRPATCRRSYHAGLLISLVAGALMICALPFGDLVFETFSSGEEVISRQKAYYDICTAGGVFLFGQMAAQAYFTGLGKTRVVFWVNVIGNLINVALDPILIFGWWGVPKLGISGAAYATVFATFVQWVILTAVAHRSRETERADEGGDTVLGLAVRIVRFGVPAGVYSVLNILSFTVFLFIAESVGHVEMAVSNACFTVNYLLLAPMDGFALGAATLVGQAQGRGDAAEAVRAGTRTMTLGVAFVAVLSAAVLLFHRPLLDIFASEVGAAEAARFHSLGFVLFTMMAAWQVFDAADVVLLGCLRGAGDTKFVMWWMMTVSFGIWLPLVLVVSRCHNTMEALWFTVLVDVVVLCIGTIVRWRRGRWKGIRVV